MVSHYTRRSYVPCKYNYVRNLYTTRSKIMKQEKILQVVNLSPDPMILQKFEQMHPMRMVFWASITQICVLGFMALCMQIIHWYTQ